MELQNANNDGTRASSQVEIEQMLPVTRTQSSAGGDDVQEGGTVRVKEERARRTQGRRVELGDEDCRGASTTGGHDGAEPRRGQGCMDEELEDGVIARGLGEGRLRDGSGIERGSRRRSAAGGELEGERVRLSTIWW